MPTCDICGIDKPAKGFHNHVKNCKGLDVPEAEVYERVLPDVEKVKNMPVKEMVAKIINSNDKTDSTEKTNSDTSPPVMLPEVESESKPQEGVSPIVVFAIIFFAVILAIFVFFKDEILKIIHGEKNVER